MLEDGVTILALLVYLLFYRGVMSDMSHFRI